MNDVTDEQVNQVLQLRKEGYSVRDTAASLGLKNWQVQQISRPNRFNHQMTVLDPQKVVLQTEKDATGQHDYVEQEQLLADARAKLESEKAAINAKARMLTAQESTLATRVAGVRADLGREKAALGVKARELTDHEGTLATQTKAHEIAVLENNRKLLDLQIKEQQLTQEKRDLDRQRADLHQTMAASSSEKEGYEDFRKHSRKEQLTERYNSLIDELVRNCDGCKWTGQEVDDYLERADSIKDKITAFCQESGINETDLLIYQGLIFVIDLMEKDVEEQTSGIFSSSSVKVDYGPITTTKVKSLPAVAFYDTAPNDLHDFDSPEEQ